MGIPDPLPLIVLAGRDRQRGSVPRGVDADDVLSGYKGAIVLPNGRPLVAEVMSRYRQSGWFQDPLLVGPRGVYAPLEVESEIVDIEADLAGTLAQVNKEAISRFGPLTPVAISTCNVIPDVTELCELLDQWYAPHSESVFWGQLVRAEPRELGESGWKPRYQFVDPQRQPMMLYPGHLVIVRPAALRLEVTSRLLQLAYHYRNTPLWWRAMFMTVRGLGVLALQDLNNLLLHQWPTLTVSIPVRGLAGYLQYLGRRLRVSDFERHFARTFVHRRFQGTTRERPVVFSVTRSLSLAKDIDTRQELEEAIGVH